MGIHWASSTIAAVSDDLKVREKSLRRVNPIFMMMGLVLLNGVNPLPAEASDWQIGDVFAGVGNGEYNVYSNAGTFKEIISQGVGGFTTGCAFNATATRLYTTNFSTTQVFVFDSAHPHPVVQTIDTNKASPGDLASESIVFAAAGDFYVGHADGDADIHKYNAAGVFQQDYDVAGDRRGSDWIDLAADQMTMFYTSEGRLIKRFNVSGTGTQLADFATLPGNGTAYALRLLPPGTGAGGLLVADTFDVKRLDGLGNVIQKYDVDGEDSWFSLNLDPDGLSFWAGNFETGNFYKFNIATGAVLVKVATNSDSLFGLCVLGEPTAAVPSSTPGKVSLGGFIDSAGNLVGGSELLLKLGPLAGVGKATFGGNVQFRSGDPSPTGNVRYIDHVTGDDIKATSFSSLVISDGACGMNTHAMFTGKATVNGVPDQDFKVDVDDCAEPGSSPGAGPDMLMITVTGPNQLYANGGPLVGGNIQVRKE